jgi:hypothetical protein
MTDVRNSRLLLSLTAREHALIKAAAARRNISMSELIRKIVFASLDRQEAQHVTEY